MTDEDKLFDWIVGCIVLTIFLPFFSATIIIPLVWLFFFLVIIPMETGGRSTKNPKYIDRISNYYTGEYRYDAKTNELIGEVDPRTRELKDKTPEQIQLEWKEKDDKEMERKNYREKRRKIEKEFEKEILAKK